MNVLNYREGSVSVATEEVKPQIRLAPVPAPAPEILGHS